MPERDAAGPGGPTARSSRYWVIRLPADQAWSARSSSPFDIFERPEMPLARAVFIRSALVWPEEPPEEPELLRAAEAFLATSFGCLENCLPFRVSARFLSDERSYSASDTALRAFFGR